MSHIIKDVLKNLSIDCTIFGFDNSRLEILLIKRARKPGKGMWALPGGIHKEGRATGRRSAKNFERNHRHKEVIS
ncbi:MAG TPA: hypothetical protein VHP30_12375 [Ignavibacteriales bacterium]|nr:hypothetical protein [Ignavibacteriales bacterium]